MATPTPDQLGVYYTSKDLTADGAAIPNRVTGSDSSVLSISVPAMTEATDFWNGAIGTFIGTSTATSALRGFFFHVRKWDLATKKLALAQPLPIAPATGDTFQIIASGKTASNCEVHAMKVSGKQPEIEPVAGTSITGVTIKKASALLGEGTLTLSYVTSPARALTIRMGSANPGPEVTITANATNLPVFNADLSGYVLVDVNFTSLPTSSRSDTFTITVPKGNLIPSMEGYETNDGAGRTRYHLIVAKNKSTSPLDAMTAFSIWTGRPAGNQTTVTASYSYSADTPGSISVSNASTWPTRGFWVRRTVSGGSGDIRYVDYRSSNTLYVKPVTWGYLRFQNGTTELKPGMAINGTTYSATAIIDQVVLTGGSWSAGTAAGTLILKKFINSFYNTEAIRVDNVQVAQAVASSTRGYRGYTATTWYNNDRIEPLSDIDIGLNLPSAGLYKNPETENIAPDGITFGIYQDQTEAMILESVMAGSSVGIWTRETILDGTQARQDLDGSVYISWY
ncbi:MAG: hypothetical protein FWH27_17940 [Planctomycetaceae bacterium]|nr:hypothetical protein [Planctomycetaceae bacterium]